MTTTAPIHIDGSRPGEPILGVIGGLGPRATLDFCERILDATPAKTDQDHIHVIVDNYCKIPNRQEAILNGGSSPLPTLLESARRLQQAGANFLAMPCNTAHAYAADIASEVSIPFIHMVNVVCEHILAEHENLRRVGLLATDACIASSIHRDVFLEKGIDVLLPDRSDQEIVTAAVVAVKSEGAEAQQRQGLMDVIDRLVENGAQAIVAGCTEIPLVLDSWKPRIPMVDGTQVLAEYCVRYAQTTDIQNQ